MRAVDDLSFALERGTVTGFLGPNGAGKTMTDQLLAELRKMRSTRTNLGLLAGMVLLTLLTLLLNRLSLRLTWLRSWATRRRAALLLIGEPPPPLDTHAPQTTHARDR